MVNARAGFGLVEAVVALTVLSTGILAVTGVAGVAAGLLGKAEEERRSARLAAWLADSLGAHAAPVNGTRTAGALVARWTLRPSGQGTALRLEVGHSGAAPHVFETLLAPPPPRLREGW